MYPDLDTSTYVLGKALSPSNLGNIERSLDRQKMKLISSPSFSSGIGPEKKPLLGISSPREMGRTNSVGKANDYDGKQSVGHRLTVNCTLTTHQLHCRGDCL